MKSKFKYICLFLFLFSKFYSQSSSSKILEKSGFEKEVVCYKKDTIIYLHNKIFNRDFQKPLIIFVQGSKDIPLLFTDKDSTKVGCVIPFNYKDYLDKYNFVIIARKGVSLIGIYNESGGYFHNDKNVSLEFKKNDNLEYRTFQLEHVIKKLNKQNWVNKKKIYLIGHSEGYRVVAKYSEKDKYVDKYVFMSADPFNRVAEDVTRNRLECFYSNEDSIFQKKIENSLIDANNLKMGKKNDSKDYELKNWLSYNSELTYNSLKKIKKASLIIYGTDDIVSFNNDIMNFMLDKNIFKIIALPNLDHNYFKQEFDKSGNPSKKSFHWDEVFKSVVNWIEEK